MSNKNNNQKANEETTVKTVEQTAEVKPETEETKTLPDKKVHKFLGYEITKAEKPAKENKTKEKKPKPSKKQIAARIVGGAAVAAAAGKLVFDFIGGRQTTDSTEKLLNSVSGEVSVGNADSQTTTSEPGGNSNES